MGRRGHGACTWGVVSCAHASEKAVWGQGRSYSGRYMVPKQTYRVHLPVVVRLEYVCYDQRVEWTSGIW